MIIRTHHSEISMYYSQCMHIITQIKLINFSCIHENLNKTPERSLQCVLEVPKRAAGALRGVSCMLRYEKGLERSVSCRNRKPEACLYPSFLALMQEKKQKKIKASGTPADFVGCPIDH